MKDREEPTKEIPLRSAKPLKVISATPSPATKTLNGSESGQTSPTALVGAELTYPALPIANHNATNGTHSFAGINHSPSSSAIPSLSVAPPSPSGSTPVSLAKPHPPPSLPIPADRQNDPSSSIWSSFLTGIGLSGKGQQTQQDKDRNLAKIQQEQLKLKEKEKILLQQQLQSDNNYSVYTSGLEYYHLFEFGAYDKLLADYPCSALTIDTVLKGKCYLSKTYFSFHSQRTKQQILVVLPWVEILELRLSPNKPPHSIIQVFTSDSKVHQFSGFQTSIDTIFNLMQFILFTAKSQFSTLNQSPQQERKFTQNGNTQQKQSDTLSPPPLENIRLELAVMSPKRGHRRSGSTVY
eukprot:TRINITY_DN9708_c0_g3_i1.p1 TRINITY_DN9708_c0_g3~~TRINITY_DN9708_c0_g3_i1.p1  ORF type:complete len:352 (+),score=64.95 TRINITY_DN9708_c0_g3_i1:250-1305(+)